MSLLNWLGLLWLLVVPALILLYMLRPMRQRKVVPSLRLWHSVPRIEHTRTHLRRPPLSILLLLEALALAAGAFALAQPALTSPAPTSRVVIVDASGSMQALDANKSRFDEARGQARKIIDGMGSNDLLTLLRAGTNVTTACSACNRASAENALSAMTPGAGDADIAGALSVASGIARQSSNLLEAVIISDGEYAPVDTGSINYALRFVQVGSAVSDVAITSLSARRPPDGQSGYIAFAKIQNMGTSDVNIEVAAQADTVPLPTRSESVPAGGNVGITWQVSAGTARFTVNVSPADSLPVDNQAVIFLPTAGEYAVKVTSPHPDLYVRALASIDGFQAVTNTTAPDPAFSIVQGTISGTLPSGNLLLIAPDGDFLSSSGTVSGARLTVLDAVHPLLAGIDLNALQVGDVNIYKPPDWLETLVDSPKGPLIMAGTQNGRRIVVLAFDPQQSNLSKLAAFPLFMANAADWLSPLAGVQAIAPGQTLALPPGSQVQTPSGRSLKVGAPGLFTDTDEAGIYRVTPASGSGSQQFSVNMADKSLSAIADQQPSIGTAGHPELNHAAQTSGQQLTSQVFWLPLAALALALFGGEWLLYCWKRGSM